MTTHTSDHIGIAATAIVSTVVGWFGVVDPVTVEWLVLSGSVGVGAFLVFTIGDHSCWRDRVMTTIRSIIIGPLIGFGALMFVPDPWSSKLGAAIIILILSVYFGLPLVRSIRRGTAATWLLAFRAKEVLRTYDDEHNPGRRRGD